MYFYNKILSACKWNFSQFLPKFPRDAVRRSLSPYIFILTMEGLSQIVWRAREGGFILGYNVGGKDGKRQEMSHLLHVDGTLVIYDTSKTIVIFELVSHMV